MGICKASITPVKTKGNALESFDGRGYKPQRRELQEDSWGQPGGLWCDPLVSMGPHGQEKTYGEMGKQQDPL